MNIKNILQYKAAAFAVILALNACGPNEPLTNDSEPKSGHDLAYMPAHVAIKYRELNPLVCQSEPERKIQTPIFDRPNRIDRVKIFAEEAICEELRGNHDDAEQAALTAIMLSDLMDYEGEWIVLALSIIVERGHSDIQTRAWAHKRLSDMVGETRNSYDWSWLSFTVHKPGIESAEKEFIFTEFGEK